MPTVDARPQPLTLDLQTTAVIVVDMQNDFGADEGMFARAGIDISCIKAVVQPIARVLDVARDTGMPVVYLKMGFAPDLSDAGDPGSANFARHVAKFGVGQPVSTPDGGTGHVLIRNTWGTDILPKLAPQPGDHLVEKHRFSGFFETELDGLLQQLGVNTLLFTGCTTSVCVESTLRDAFYRDYRCLLLSDCCAEPIGQDLPRSNHDATLLVVQLLFGWVAESASVIQALAQQPAAAAAD